MRIRLVHPQYTNKTETKKIPDIFDTVKKEYPPNKSKKILEDVIDTLLKDSNLIHLKDTGKIEGYSGPIRAV